MKPTGDSLPKQLPLSRRPGEICRKLCGRLLSFGLKSWGVAMILGVILGPGETVDEKAFDAVHAVPTFIQTGENLATLIKHREEIASALENFKQRAPSEKELNKQVENAEEIVAQIESVFHNLKVARDKAWKIIEFEDIIDNSWAVFTSLKSAWYEKPEVDTIKELFDAAIQLGGAAMPLLDLLDLRPLYQQCLNACDNLSPDEIAPTVLVAAAAYTLAYLLAILIGQFWSHRGLPGFFVRYIQRLGIRVFPAFYRDNLPEILGHELYEIARDHFASHSVPAGHDLGDGQYMCDGPHRSK